MKQPWQKGIQRTIEVAIFLKIMFFALLCLKIRCRHTKKVAAMVPMQKQMGVKDRKWDRTMKPGWDGSEKSVLRLSQNLQCYLAGIRIFFG